MWDGLEWLKMVMSHQPLAGHDNANEVQALLNAAADKFG